MHLELWQWILGGVAALFVGISKTGVPGAGILVVPLLAAVFGGRPTVGIMLPMLIFADCFAVAWYKRHAQWDKLAKLFVSSESRTPPETQHLKAAYHFTAFAKPTPKQYRMDFRFGIRSQ